MLNTSNWDLRNWDLQPEDTIDAPPSNDPYQFVSLQSDIYIPRTGQCHSGSTVFLEALNQAGGFVKIALRKNLRFGEQYRKLWPTTNVRLIKNRASRGRGNRQRGGPNQNVVFPLESIELTFRYTDIAYMTSSSSELCLGITTTPSEESGTEVIKLVFLGSYDVRETLYVSLNNWFSKEITPSKVLKWRPIEEIEPCGPCIRWILSRTPDEANSKKQILLVNVKLVPLTSEMSYDLKRLLFAHAHRLLQSEGTGVGDLAALQQKCQGLQELSSLLCKRLNEDWNSPRLLLEPSGSGRSTEPMVYFSQDNRSFKLSPPIRYQPLFPGVRAKDMIITFHDDRVRNTTNERYVRQDQVQYWRTTEMVNDYSLTVQYTDAPYYLRISFKTRELLDAEVQSFHSWIGPHRAVSALHHLRPLNVWNIRRLYHEATGELKSIGEPKYFTKAGLQVPQVESQIAWNYKRLLRQLINRFALILVSEIGKSSAPGQPISPKAKKTKDTKSSTVAVPKAWSSSKLIDNHRFYCSLCEQFKEAFAWQEAPVSYGDINPRRAPAWLFGDGESNPKKPLFEYSWLFGQYDEPN